MSTATKEAPKKTTKTVAENSLGHQTVTDFVKSLKGNGDDEDVAKILGISEERRNTLRYWVDCEGTNLQAIKNFTQDLANVEEAAYCFYWLGVLNHEKENSSLLEDDSI